MKSNKLIKKLVDSGCYMKRHGSRHDIYINPQNGRQAPIPRHNETKESLVHLILKQLGIQ